MMTVPLVETEKCSFSENSTENLQRQEHSQDEKETLIPILHEQHTAKYEFLPTSRVLTLERKSNVKRTLVFITVFIFMEISKQLSTFGLSKSYQNQFPLPSTVILALVEGLKLLAVLIWGQVSNNDISKARPSFKFSIPAACYFLTNLLYLFVLKLTSPPMWMVLIQSRTLYTALAYRVVFSREVTCVQMIGCILVVISIPLARLSDFNSGHNSVSLTVILLSQTCATLSTVACIAVELLLKNDGRGFQEQQMWLYSWGVFFAMIAVALQNEPTEILYGLQDVVLQNHLIFSLLCVTVFSTAIGGLCVPFIVKNLDSIVKDYTAAMNNIILAVLTATLFPQDFSLSIVYAISLVVLLSGIYL
ncbi:unnamed protein product, partial [Meganyctiphanes norvegica]